MYNLVFFDGPFRNQLLPFTFTRPTAEIRIGILTIFEKWQKYFSSNSVSFITEEYLSKKYKCQSGSTNLFIHGAVCPTPQLVDEIENLPEGYALFKENLLISVKGDKDLITLLRDNDFVTLNKIECDIPFTVIENVWDIFIKNDTEIKNDYRLITQGRMSQNISESNRIIGSKEDIFIEAGAKIEASVINILNGPVYIGKNAEIMEGCLIRGPFAMVEESQLKMGAKIYGATTIGPHCKIGGEVNNSVIFGYSNKAHDGFLGNSVIGEWCNLGADTNNSNLKNNYADVKLYSYVHKRLVSTGLQFCGLMMGDHSKCGINTMFNTGTVVGVSCNIFGEGFPPNYIPSFTWGGNEKLEDYQFDKAMESAERVLSRRKKILDETERKILHHIANMS